MHFAFNFDWLINIMNATLKLKVQFSFAIFLMRNDIFCNNLFTIKKLFETTNGGIFGDINVAVIPYAVGLHSWFCVAACISSGLAATI